MKIAMGSWCVAFLGLATGAVMAQSSVGQKFELKTHEIEIEKELLITAPEVVDSKLTNYPGAWSFGHLLEEAFGKEEARAVVAEWLWEWTDGGPGMAPRPNVETKLIRPWMAADGDLLPEQEWLPDLSNAPFQLLAIVNRMDLSPRFSAGSYGRPSGDTTSAGEGRLIYGLLDQNGEPLEGGTTIIFEYKLDSEKGADFRDWASAWHSLGWHRNFSEKYITDLELVTRAFTDRRKWTTHHWVEGKPMPAEVMRSPSVAKPGLRPHEGCLLMRVRINDGALGETREFREFVYTPQGLKPNHLPGTPSDRAFIAGSPAHRTVIESLNGLSSQSLLGRFSEPVRDIPTSEATMVARVPANDASYHFAAPSPAETTEEMTREKRLELLFPDDNTAQVEVPIVLNDAGRRTISMGTCCGCHCGDTETKFFHIGPRKTGERAEISQFLRTDQSRWRLRDPASGDRIPSNEMVERKKLFETMLNPDPNSRELREIRRMRANRAH